VKYRELITKSQRKMFLKRPMSSERLRFPFRVSTFQYSIIPWPRPGMQGQHSMGTTSETLQRQKCFPRNSRQGRPSFHVRGKKIRPQKLALISISCRISETYASSVYASRVRTGREGEASLKHEPCDYL